jgi:hypothetical protein
MLKVIIIILILNGLQNARNKGRSKFTIQLLLPRWLCRYVYFYLFSLALQPSVGLWPPRFTRFLDHTRRATVGRTPLDEWSARRRDLYLTPHNTQQTNIHALVGFEPTIAAGERP